MKNIKDFLNEGKVPFTNFKLNDEKFFRNLNLKKLLDSKAPILDQFAAVKTYMNQSVLDIDDLKYSTDFYLNSDGYGWNTMEEVRKLLNKNNIKDYTKDTNTNLIIEKIHVDTIYNLIKEFGFNIDERFQITKAIELK